LGKKKKGRKNEKRPLVQYEKFANKKGGKRGGGERGGKGPKIFSNALYFQLKKLGVPLLRCDVRKQRSPYPGGK